MREPGVLVVVGRVEGRTVAAAAISWMQDGERRTRLATGGAEPVMTVVRKDRHRGQRQTWEALAQGATGGTAAKAGVEAVIAVEEEEDRDPGCTGNRPLVMAG
jgi:hypothetical protein